MEGYGYWLFLLIMYMLSTMMKKRQQKQRYEEFDQEEDNNWKTPEFVKDIFTDFVDNAKESFIVDSTEETENELDFEYTEEPNDVDLEFVHTEEQKELSLDHMDFQGSDLSTFDRHDEISSIEHREVRQKKKVHHKLFRHNNDLLTAIIYKEILGKPRSLQRSIR